MLSILVSSYNTERFKDFYANVKDTIGRIPYEIIKIDNNGLMSITQAYNLAAQQARYEFLLFVHDDINFCCINWGEKLAGYLKLPDAGIIGVAGCVYKSAMVSSWYQPTIDNIEFNRYHYIQAFKYQEKSAITMISNPFNEKLSKVITVDGVFMAVKKNVWLQHQFDENIKGFHGYDMSYSLSVSSKFQNYVCYDILLEHLSEGLISIEWVTENIKVHKLYSSVLPQSCISLKKSTSNELEKVNCISLISLIKKYSNTRATQLSLLKEVISLYKLAFLKPLYFYYIFKSLI